MAIQLNNPAHPGETIQTLYLEPLGISTEQAALSLGIDPDRLQSLIDGTTSVNPELAIRLAKSLGNTSAFWLKLQNNYDIAQLESNHPEGWPEVVPIYVAS